MLNSISLKVKFSVMAAIPLVVVLVFSSILIKENYYASKNAVEINHLVNWAVANSQLVHELQKERGLTAGFIGSKGSDVFKQKLIKQRRLTDKKKEQKINSIKVIEKNVSNEQLKQIKRQNVASLAKLVSMRQKIDQLSIPASEAIGYFTQTNANLLSVVHKIAETAEIAEVKQQALAYYYFIQGKERAGIERAVLSNIFAKDTMSLKNYLRTNELAQTQDSYVNEFSKLAVPELMAFYEQAIRDSSVAKVIEYRKIAAEKNIAGVFGVDAATWFDAATARINVLKNIEDKIADYVLSLAQSQESDASYALYFYIVTSFLVVASCIFCGVIIARSVRIRVFTLGKRVKTCNIK